MEIYYQDKDIIVCHKPYGVSSQECDGEGMVTLLSDLTHTQAFAVHRLDVTTEGLMVYALNKESAANLNAQFSERACRKSYIALAHGKPSESVGEMTDLLFHDKRINKSFVVDKKRHGVKDARLEYRLIGYGKTHDGDDASVLKIDLHTGRTHQIRVQLGSRGMPLIGDKKYGARSSGRMLLLSAELELSHPRTGEPLRFALTEDALAVVFDRFTEFTRIE